MARRIMSLASAPGWKARFESDDEVEGYRLVTLAAWALVADGDDDSEIVGVVQRAADAPSGRLGLADEVDGFDGYTFTGLVTRAPDSY